jgi:ankyrin repeat protein
MKSLTKSKADNFIRFYLLFLSMTVSISGCTHFFASLSLNHAIFDGDTESVRNIITQNKDLVNVRFSDSFTPLQIAVQENKREIFEILLEAGANVNEKNKYGLTSLMMAAWKGHKRIAEMLIANGANVNIKDNNGWTALMLAASRKHPKIAELLIMKGADIEARNNHGATALYLAAYKGDREIASLLMEKGSTVDTKTYTGFTPLMAAAFNGHGEIVKLLVEKGAEINAKNKHLRTPLYFASYSDQKEIAEYLIEAGAKASIIENNADDIFATAQSYRLVAESKERAEDMEKAIEHYLIAAEYYQKASSKLMDKSHKYGREKAMAVTASLLGKAVSVLDSMALSKGISSVPDPTRDKDLERIGNEAEQAARLQQKYAEKSDRCHKLSVECHAAAKRLREVNYHP